MKPPTVGLPENQVRSSTKRRPFMGPLLVLLTASVLASAAATQYLAARFAYQAALGEPIYGHFYAPWDWLVWALQFYQSDKGDFDKVYVALVIALGVFFFAYALFVSLRFRRSRSITDLHGSAHWATKEEIVRTGLMPASGQKGAGVYVGGWRDPAGGIHYLRHNGPEHVLAFAPTRSGKGVGLILPTLLSWPESAVIFDLKGENWALTSGWRQQAGHTVLAFDPTDSSGMGVGYNPLEEVRIGTEHEVADAQNIVQQIVDPEGKGLESHWDKTSFMFLVGVILYTIHYHKALGLGSFASLTDVADMLSNTAGIDQLYAKMKGNTFGPNGSCHAVVAKAAIDMLETPERERGSTLSTVKTNFALYRDPVVSKNIAQSGFRISDLMNSEQPVSLYIIVDPTNKARLKPLIRLILTQIVRNLTPRLKFVEGQAVKPYKHRLLLMLDEFPSLGKLPIFEDALAHIAGYGMKAYLITQDLSQLAAVYGKDEGIIANCQVRIATAPNKIETANLLSEMTGTATVIKRQVATSGGRASLWLRNVNESLQEHERPLLTPDECMRLPSAKKDAATDRITEAGDMLVFVAGHPPIYGKQILFFKDPVFSARSKIPAPDKSAVLRT